VSCRVLELRAEKFFLIDESKHKNPQATSKQQQATRATTHVFGTATEQPVLKK